MDSHSVGDILSALPLVYEKIWSDIVAQGCQLVVERIEMPLIPVVAAMET